jgi:hypothetical protein
MNDFDIYKVMQTVYKGRISKIIKRDFLIVKQINASE